MGVRRRWRPERVWWAVGLFGLASVGCVNQYDVHVRDPRLVGVAPTDAPVPIEPRSEMPAKYGTFERRADGGISWHCDCVSSLDLVPANGVITERVRAWTKSDTTMALTYVDERPRRRITSGVVGVLRGAPQREVLLVTPTANVVTIRRAEKHNVLVGVVFAGAGALAVAVAAGSSDRTKAVGVGAAGVGFLALGAGFVLRGNRVDVEFGGR